MGYGGTGTTGAPYFDGSFILFLVLILLVFGMGFFPFGGGMLNLTQGAPGGAFCFTLIMAGLGVIMKL